MRISNLGLVMGGVHLAELGLGTTSDLLGAQLHELLLQLIQLLLEVLFVLAPKLGSLDLARRLHFHRQCV